MKSLEWGVPRRERAMRKSFVLLLICSLIFIDRVRGLKLNVPEGEIYYEEVHFSDLSFPIPRGAIVEVIINEKDLRKEVDRNGEIEDRFSFVLDFFKNLPVGESNRLIIWLALGMGDSEFRRLLEVLPATVSSLCFHFCCKLRKVNFSRFCNLRSLSLYHCDSIKFIGLGSGKFLEEFCLGSRFISNEDAESVLSQLNGSLEKLTLHSCRSLNIVDLRGLYNLKDFYFTDAALTGGVVVYLPTQTLEVFEVTSGIGNLRNLTLEGGASFKTLILSGRITVNALDEVLKRVGKDLRRLELGGTLNSLKKYKIDISWLPNLDVSYFQTS